MQVIEHTLATLDFLLMKDKLFSHCCTLNFGEFYYFGAQVPVNLSQSDLSHAILSKECVIGIKEQAGFAISTISWSETLNTFSSPGETSLR